MSITMSTPPTVAIAGRPPHKGSGRNECVVRPDEAISHGRPPGQAKYSSPEVPTRFFLHQERAAEIRSGRQRVRWQVRKQDFKTAIAEDPVGPPGQNENRRADGSSGSI